MVSIAKLITVSSIIPSFRPAFKLNVDSWAWQTWIAVKRGTWPNFFSLFRHVKATANLAKPRWIDNGGTIVPWYYYYHHQNLFRLSFNFQVWWSPELKQTKCLFSTREQDLEGFWILKSWDYPFPPKMAFPVTFLILLYIVLTICLRIG